MCECGCEKMVSMHKLTQNHTTTCGCKKKPFKDYGNIPGSWLNKIRQGNAINRNIDFHLTPELVNDLWLKQDGKCAYTGIELKITKFINFKGTIASIDRINSKKGYVIDNVQLVHKDVNIMKHALNEEYFINMCCLIAKNRKDISNG